MSTFQGIPAAAFDFYAELQANNSRDWWLANNQRYQSAVREPLLALLAELEPRFGPAKVFRPQRDMRFAKGAGPYKPAQGAFASLQEGVGYYLHLGAEGLSVGGGYRSYSAAQLARYRNSVDATATGENLRRIVAGLETAGFEVHGEQLKTVPQGFPRDHPRAELLRYKTLAASMELGRPAWLATPEGAQQIELLWDGLRPLVEWVGRHAAP